MGTQAIRLFSDDLLSKWGFGDGDAPDHWYDYCDDRNLPWGLWHPILCELVRRFLLPVLDQQVETVRICTSHNPIRATTVDGANVEDSWYLTKPPVSLTPEYVDIPLAEVARIAESIKNRPGSLA